jgi:hypothetical protein
MSRAGLDWRYGPVAALLLRRFGIKNAMAETTPPGNGLVEEIALLDAELARLAVAGDRCRARKACLERQLRSGVCGLWPGALVVIVGGKGYRGRKAVVVSERGTGSGYWNLEVRKRKCDSDKPRIYRTHTNLRLIVENKA